MDATPLYEIEVSPFAHMWMSPLLHLGAAIGFVASWPVSSRDEAAGNALIVAAIALAILARIVTWRLKRQLRVVRDGDGVSLEVARDGLTLRGAFRVECGLVPSTRGDAHDPSVTTMRWLRVTSAGGRAIEIRALARAGAPRSAEWPLAPLAPPSPDIVAYVAPDADLEGIAASLGSA